tara:strand:- start:54589 stop:55371 length:783 start_codon:yes stop_codon:yes gene_type:complete
VLVKILGSGHSGGTPMIGEGWGGANPLNPKNRRTRPSILVEDADTTILIDTSPDLRLQLINANVQHIDALLYTHSHADHLHGIDDLRAINRCMNRWIPTYANKQTWDDIAERFGYVLDPLKGDTKFFYKPCLEKNEINVGDRFKIGNFVIDVFEQDHGFLKTLGFRINEFAYSTDVVEMPESSFSTLSGIDTWIVGTLWEEPHITHAHVNKAIEWSRIVKPRRLVLSHLSHKIDYDEVSLKIASDAELAYDGMILEFPQN